MTTAHVAADTVSASQAAFLPLSGSADADTLNENPIMTSRARDLVRNNAVASGIDQTLCDNIIGSQLRLSSQAQYRLLGKDKAWATEFGNQIEDLFSTWADTSECDVSRSQTLWGLSVQALSGAFVNGDALALVMWLPRKDGLWSTRLQMIEADRLQTPPWLQSKDNVRGGVELDDLGAPVAYWLMKNHPGDKYGLMTAKQDEWERVPAFTSWGRRRVIHLMDKKRAGQSRGKTLFAAVVREFKISGDYLTAELQAAASNALIAAIIESDLPQQVIADVLGAQKGGVMGYYNNTLSQKHRTKMEGGMNVLAPMGTRINPFVPNRPNAAFEGFMESVMRHMATGLNVPYELLFKDFSKTNYSSARAALLEAWRYFLGRRKWLVEQWLNPIYEAWMEEAVALNRVDVTQDEYYANRFAYHRCRWMFSGRGWVDPVKEAVGAEKRMTLGLSTQQDECAEQGKDYQEVQDQRVRELSEAVAKVEAAGLPPQFALYVAGFAPTVSGDLSQYFSDSEDQASDSANGDSSVTQQDEPI